MDPAVATRAFAHEPPVPMAHGSGSSIRFHDRPLLVFWEMTRACGLACAHCRADAQPSPGPEELSTPAAFALIDELASLGSPRPILILTGGDCLIRGDLVTIVTYAKDRSVPVAIAPSVTPASPPRCSPHFERRG